MTEIFSGMGEYAYIAAILIPIAVGLLSKASWPSWVKFCITIALSVAVAAVTVWQTTDSFSWSWAFLLSIIGTAEVVYRVIVKNVPGVSEWLARNGISDPVKGPDAQ